MMVKKCFVLLLLLLFVVSLNFRVSSAVGNVAAVFLFLHSVDSYFCLKITVAKLEAQILES